MKNKLAAKHSVTPDNIIVAAGSIALMDMSIKGFVGFDENIVTAEITFEGYKYMARVNRRDCRLARLVDNAISLEEYRKLGDEKTRLVFIANPNNPTGTMLTQRELEDYLDAVSSDVNVISDEAYAEYITDADFPDSLSLQRKYPNLVIFRTFSKIYGLAGLRIGYAIAHPDKIKSLRQSWTPFSVSGLALVAASAALEDEEYVIKCAEMNAVEREFLYSELKALGFNAIQPHGNFIFIGFDTPDKKSDMLGLLDGAGVIVRPLDRFGIETALRITVGRPDENRRLIEILKNAT